MSDGDYNVSANVTDVAGNKAYGVVDPIIDNNPPMISNFAISEDPCVDGEMTINFYVTDIWSGVNSSSVTAQLELPNGTIVDLVLTPGNVGLFTAKYTPVLAGIYNITIYVDAADRAVPPNVASTSVTVHELDVDAECPSSSGGGGGGGSNPTLGTACELKHWNCGNWGGCLSGVQTRNCEKVTLPTGKVCYNGVEPETSRTCSVPGTGGGADVQLPTELIPEPEQQEPEQQVPREKKTMWEQLSESISFWLVLLGLLLLALAFMKYSTGGSGGVDKIVAKYKKSSPKGKAKKPKKK